MRGRGDRDVRDRRAPGDPFGAAALLDLAGTPERLAWFRAGMLSVLEDLRAVDEDVLHADRELLRLCEGRPITDRLRIEDHHVGEHTALQEAAVVQPQVRRGKT